MVRSVPSSMLRDSVANYVDESGYWNWSLVADFSVTGDQCSHNWEVQFVVVPREMNYSIDCPARFDASCSFGVHAVDDAPESASS
ncbi:hypothetical protein GH714_016173 [Hevea brasiliensis]|uniref:Uncharacterized protein n=1 Tax=Hevea brasiliensis TaxID=3981 RepID=A0A6A6LCX7_HEVBR|nr:hypothetical protein GH714_016173 [Hevea brasiliensis]